MEGPLLLIGDTVEVEEGLEVDVTAVQDPEVKGQRVAAGPDRAARVQEALPGRLLPGRTIPSPGQEAGPDQGLGLRLYPELGMRCSISMLYAGGTCSLRYFSKDKFSLISFF